MCGVSVCALVCECACCVCVCVYVYQCDSVSVNCCVRVTVRKRSYHIIASE